MFYRSVLSAAFLAASVSFSQAADDLEVPVEPSPDWSLEIGAVYLHRDAGENRILMQDAADPTRNLSTDSFGDLDSAGVIGALNGDVFGTGFELRGILTDTASQSVNAIAGAPSLVRINAFVPFFLPGVTSVTGTRDTTFDSAEANIDIFSGGNWSIFAGGRALWVDDDLDLTLNAAVLPSTFDHNVTNRMIGPQIGAEIELQDLPVPNMQFSASARVAFMQNDVDFNNVLNTGVVVVAAAGTADNYTPVVELEANAIFNIAPNFDIELGYNYLYIQDIATSTASVANTNYFTGVIGTNGVFGSSFESATYHGATAKAVWRW